MSQQLRKSAGAAAASPRQARPNTGGWGMSDRELATYPMVYAPDLFAGKRVIISGGGTGMGKAMTFLFARLGADVVICSRTEAHLAATAQAVRKHLDVDIDYQAMTIRDPEAVDALMARVWEERGPVDFLVNNAGGQFPQPAIDFSVKGWNAVIDTNLNGTWYMMQAAARRWRDADHPGNIVNIVATITRGMPQVAHTCAARAGVIYLSKTVSTEWAPLNIRVNCVAPGAIDTEGLNVYPPGAAERFVDSNPMRTMGDAYDIAQAVAYLCAPTGKFITGDVLTIDGGTTQWGDTWPGGVPDEFKIDYS